MRILNLLILGACFTLGACSTKTSSTVQTNEYGTQWSWDKGTIVVETPERPAGQKALSDWHCPRWKWCVWDLWD